MARKPSQPAVDAKSLSHQSIAADIAEFRKRGGRIEVLGNTPLHRPAPSSFRSSPEARKAATPPATKRSASR